MIKNIKQLTVVISLLTPLFFSAVTQGAELTTVKQQASYAIGANFGRTIIQQGVELDSAALTTGIQDALKGSKLALTPEQMQTASKQYIAEMQQKQVKAQAQQSEVNKKQGEAFLAENKNKEGVVTLPSGLQYKVLKSGTGEQPKINDTVTTHYRGTLTDGTEFDSSYARNKPSSFPVSGVIKGWTEALQLMHVGDKWQLFVPPELAYGKQAPRGSKIGPDSTLIFDIELLEIKK